MENMEIKSHCGNYRVNFGDDINYKDIVRAGDIIIIDQVVYDLYKDEMGSVVTEGNTIKINATEEQKSYTGIIPVMEDIIKRGFHKNNTLIAVGGGIIQDVVAFIASIMYRGVKWELIPTTLLAQCDSCIGSKTSINFSAYKNQIGGFYPAKNVYIAPHFLKSLHEREIKSGLGEMLHYFIVGGEKDFDFFAKNCVKAMEDSTVLQKMINRSLEIKKGYIEVDEYDRNERQIFNYGHSFGHAIESMTNYAVPHGIAVSYGMDIANYIAVRMGIQKEETKERIRNVAKKFWSKNDMADIDIDAYVDFLRKDKKNKDGKLGIILCADFGKLAKYMVEADERFCQMLADYFEENGINIA